MAAYYKNKNKKEINILLTDPGEEIDDEVAIECAVNTCQNSVWFICCVPGCSSENPNSYAIEIEKRLILFKNLFPSFEISIEPYKTGWYLRLRTQYNSVFYVGSPSMLFSNNVLTEVFPKMPYNENKLYVDNLIQIAPLWHIDPQLFNDIIIKNYIVMGDLDNPDQSLNLTKAMPVNNIYSDLRHEYVLQQKTIRKNTENILYITTNLARNVSLPYSLIRKLPNHLTDPLLNKAFTLCVSRVPADKCYANNISIVNHNTILNYCSESQKKRYYLQ
uniref:Uncharacterized protein n=1 Tax=Florenciella sp. virus SA2 TaxID=3240092 RepID=A0AB39JF42_9VIRU